MFGKGSGEASRQVNNQRSAERQALVREATVDAADVAKRAEFRFLDYLRVEQLSEEAVSGGDLPVAAGWIGEYEWEYRKSDG